MFLNSKGDGYEPNPLGGPDEEYVTQANEVSVAMGTAWVNFVTSLDPNGKSGLSDEVAWPEYSSSNEGAGESMVFDLDNIHVEVDDSREEGITWFIEHALSVFGN